MQKNFFIENCYISLQAVICCVSRSCTGRITVPPSRHTVHDTIRPRRVPYRTVPYRTVPYLLPLEVWSVCVTVHRASSRSPQDQSTVGWAGKWLPGALPFKKILFALFIALECGFVTLHLISLYAAKLLLVLYIVFFCALLWATERPILGGNLSLVGHKQLSKYISVWPIPMLYCHITTGCHI